MSADLIAAARAALISCRSEIWRLLDVKGIKPQDARQWPEIVQADAALAALAAAPAPAPICACSADLLLASYAGGAAPGGLHSRLTMHVDGVPVDYVPAPALIAQVLTDEQIDHHWRAAYSEGAYRHGTFDWFAAGWRRAETFFGIGAQPQPLTDADLYKIAQTMGKRKPGVSDYDSWGMGYARDETGAYCIPEVPTIAIRYARAVLAAAGIGAQEQPR